MKGEPGAEAWPGPDDDETPGLAGERTDLAWSRTGLALLTFFATIGKLLLTVRGGSDEAGAAAVVAGLLVLGGLTWLASLVYARGVARSTIAGRRVADPATLRRTAAGTAALGLAGLVLALVVG